MLGNAPGLSLPNGRPGNGVVGQSRVWVEVDTWISRLVECGSQNSRRVLCASASDVNVDTEWIVLSSIQCTATVESDDFVAEYVMTCNQRLTNVL